jgi:hypothetical protein
MVDRLVYAVLIIWCAEIFNVETLSLAEGT